MHLIYDFINLQCSASVMWFFCEFLGTVFEETWFEVDLGIARQIS